MDNIYSQWWKSNDKLYVSIDNGKIFLQGVEQHWMHLRNKFGLLFALCNSAWS